MTADVELWIFVTAACLFSCSVGSVATYLAVNWSRDRQEEADQQRRENAIEHGLKLAQENQRLEQRISGDTPAVDDDEWAMARMVGMVEPDDRRDGLSRSIDERWDAAVGTTACNPVVVWAGANWTVSCTCGHQDDGYDTGHAAHEAMSRHLARCGWSDGDTACGDPAAGTVTWPEGPVDLCATHLAWVRENEDAPVVSD